MTRLLRVCGLLLLALSLSLEPFRLMARADEQVTAQQSLESNSERQLIHYQPMFPDERQKPGLAARDVLAALPENPPQGQGLPDPDGARGRDLLCGIQPGRKVDRFFQ